MTGPGYDPSPRYPSVGGPVTTGWDGPVAGLPAAPLTLAVDGPATQDWPRLAADLAEHLRARFPGVEALDTATLFAPWETVVERTTSAELPDDPDFARLAEGTLADLLDASEHPEPPAEGVLLVHGPGAALLPHDVLWYADRPKRCAEAEITAGTGRNLGQRTGAGTTRRLFYVDWPLLDRHRDALLARVDRWVDVQDPDVPASVDGATLRRTAADLAARPFRTRPFFNSTSWGGHWAQQELGVNPDAPSTALGYELIAPESGVLLGDGPEAQVEIPFAAVVALHPTEVLGADVHERFGTSFPVRFDYLDTVGGGSLSVHCHPQPEYMSTVFGWPYTQHETYYVMETSGGRSIYLGLHEDVDVEAFHAEAHAAAHEAVPFDITDHVQEHPATAHQLYLVPAGTPHGSGEGNVVLEISATPYLYSLRFYDWLRRDAAGRQRPVHVGHAFRNLDTTRQGKAVHEQLIQDARPQRAGEGWREELIGALPEMFFEVRRLALDAGASAPVRTGGSFHVWTVVEGEAAVFSAGGRTHRLAYAETMVVPAAVGGYTVEAAGRTRLVQALVP
ncbi:class I mannose-6-phosphate isomerase [Pseudonocardia kunmingensis]|uniref:Mannose-6-phosphate isomerase class I n=1 Tax=Pseudonocardia kunmingensis TaxID=630975 RepID=A0A543DA56_9PSEU|nr:class I mannose-6-phosphate isomerase [Pseudonocardia kunmingensis]TQM06211.1 mannose-6-phosphate isomerase class I [Pseudonocardia kunmingensis]